VKHSVCAYAGMLQTLTRRTNWISSLYSDMIGSAFSYQQNVNVGTENVGASGSLGRSDHREDGATALDEEYTGLLEEANPQLTAAREGSTTKKSNAKPVDNGKNKAVGLLALVVLIFYEVSGGPFGIEDIVRAGGPFYALLGFSLFLVWSIPEALITAELSTALPEASGSVAWVDLAFGPFWAFQEGWLSWLSGVADNALYPILFLDCLVGLLDNHDNNTTTTTSSSSSSSRSSHNHVVSSHQSSNNIFETALLLEEDHLVVRWVFILSFTILLTYLNYRGLDVVGNLAIALCVLTLLPFLVFCICGIPHVQPQRWLQTPEGGWQGVDWALLLNTFFWNINFWESAGCFAGEVKNPSRDYPMGLALSMLLVFFTLFLPILVATGASSLPYHDWKDGSFVALAKQIVGPWLAYWMVLAATLSNIGMFEAEMSSDSWQIAGMADRGILPTVLGTRSRYNTPVYGILLSTVGVLCLGWLSFGEVVSMLNLLYCYSQLIEFAAYLQLRVDRPDLPRPFRVPVPTWGAAVMLLGPVCFIGVIMVYSSLYVLLLSLFMVLLGAGVYQLLHLARTQGWCRFAERGLSEDGLGDEVGDKMHGSRDRSGDGGGSGGVSDTVTIEMPGVRGLGQKLEECCCDFDPDHRIRSHSYTYSLPTTTATTTATTTSTNAK